jgi:hypothetical protein
MRNLALILCAVGALFAGVDAQAAETEFVPEKFAAHIGGFLGETYAVELRQGKLRYEVHRAGVLKNTATLTPKPEQWREFRASLDQAGAWKWKPEYINRKILDGTQWHLEIRYPDRQIQVKGSNATPKEFPSYLAAVEKLLGGKTFR